MVVRDEARGAVFLVVAMLLLPVSDGLAKLMVADYAAIQVVFLRNLVHAVLAIAMCALFGLRPTRGPIGMHFVRAITFVGMSVCFVAALRFLPLAEALAIVFIYPFLIALLAVLWLSEQANRGIWLSLSIGFLGVILILGPGLEGAFHLGAVILAFAAAVATALYNVLTRRMRDEASVIDLAFWAPVLGVLCLAPFAAVSWEPLQWADAWIFLAIGLLSALVHLCIAVAYSAASAAKLSPVSYVQLAMAVLMGWVLFDHWPGLFGFLGIAMIMAGGLSVLRTR
jgi:S-adenosylmethionine uptake transporter